MTEQPEASAPAEQPVCCVCGGGPVTYRNYRDLPFCWPCADCQCAQNPCVRTGANDPAVSAEPAEQPGRHTVDTITSDALDQLYATIRRLNYRAQRAESQNTAFRRAVAQWRVSERGTFIPHTSLAAIGRAAGTDILGSVRHLRHFQRVEQAEAAIARVRALHRPTTAYGRPTLICAACSAADSKGTTDNSPVNHPCPTLAALDPQEPTP